MKLFLLVSYFPFSQNHGYSISHLVNFLVLFVLEVGNLQAGPGDIEEVPTLLAFCETCDDAEKQELEEHMTVVAKKFLEKQKAPEKKEDIFQKGSNRE